MCSVSIHHSTYVTAYCSREVEEYAEFHCCLPMDANIPVHGFAYKYCVVHSQQDEAFEYIHGIPLPRFNYYESIRNRHFKIFEKGSTKLLHGLLVCHCTAMHTYLYFLSDVREVFHKYDSMAYPQIKISRFNFWTEKANLPDQNTMQSTALRLYLMNFKSMLRALNFSGSNAEVITSEFITIFLSLYRMNHCLDNMIWEKETYTCTHLPKVG